MACQKERSVTMRKDEEKKEQDQIEEFIAKINQCSDQEIIEHAETITKYLRKKHAYELDKKVKIFSALTIKDLNLKARWVKESFLEMTESTSVYDWPSLITILKASPDKIQEFLLDSLLSTHAFEMEQECLPISNFPHYGMELEYCSLQFQAIKTLAITNQLLAKIMHGLKIPDDFVNQITNHLVFEKKNAFTKWILSKECGNDWTPEISSPIMTNTLNDLNQLKAICLLVKELGAMTNETTGLHINIDANYFEGNVEALQNLLIIWGECEELFYKMASEEGERIREVAQHSCCPIKDNIQMALEEKLKFKLETKEDYFYFLYSIQVRNRLKTVLYFEGIDLNDYNIAIDAITEREKYKLFKKFFRRKDINDTAIRYTSLNFSHMKWYKKDKGRIEFRIFDSSLSYPVIIEDLLLIAKLCEVSLNLTKFNQKQSQFSLLQDHEVREEEKLNRLLDLLFDEEKIKEVFKHRWQSVKEDSYYQRFEGEIPTFSNREPSSHRLVKQV